jgi:hypothetical protein
MSTQQKHALTAIQSVSDGFGMAWNDNTMLALATEFITEKNLGNRFFDFCTRHAQNSACAFDNIAGDPMADEDDGPGEFDVDVCRTGFGHKTLRIKADSAADAEEKALDQAGNHSYNEKDSDYSVQGVTRVNAAAKGSA